MEQQPTSVRQPDRKFKFKFTPLMIAVFCAGLALCAAGIAVNTWQFVLFLQGGGDSLYDYLKYFLLYFVSIFLAVLIIAMLIRSQYVITEKQLISQFGIIKSRYELNKIRSVCRLNGSNKLAVYFDDFKTKYVVIVVKDVWYDEFVKELVSRNEKIEFDFVSAEEEFRGKKK